MPDRNAASVGSSRARTAVPDRVLTDTADATRIHRFVHGIDEHARVMSDAEAAAELHDAFGALLLREGVFPATVEEVLAGIDAKTAADGPLQREMRFLVGEGSQISWSEQTKHLDRGLRLAITRGRDNTIDLLVSSGATGAPGRGFLQVIGWDDELGVFHYYERKRGVWVWAGNSRHALDPRSRGQGPFDSHVSGSLVIKELKFPWNHWRSVAATVPIEVFAPDDPARTDPLVAEKPSGAEVLEPVVRTGVQRWTDSRMAKLIGSDGKVEQITQLLAQLLATATVNLISTPQESAQVANDDELTLPLTFFVDSDTLVERLGLPAPDPPLNVSGASYLDSIERFEVALVDGHFHQPGDTHFAFFVPERAFEDVAVVAKCLDTGLLNERFVACALMVDFANPIFSPRRAALLTHVPATAQLTDGTSELPEQIAAAVAQAAHGAGADSPEAEFTAHWQLADAWRDEFATRLNDYYDAVRTRLASADGFADVVRLAVSRRRQVRALELSEGRPLLFAHTNVPDDASPLRMLPDASIQPAA